MKERSILKQYRWFAHGYMIACNLKLSQSWTLWILPYPSRIHNQNWRITKSQHGKTLEENHLHSRRKLKEMEQKLVQQLQRTCNSNTRNLLAHKELEPPGICICCGGVSPDLFLLFHLCDIFCCGLTVGVYIHDIKHVENVEISCLNKKIKKNISSIPSFFCLFNLKLAYWTNPCKHKMKTSSFLRLVHAGLGRRGIRGSPSLRHGFKPSDRGNATKLIF